MSAFRDADDALYNHEQPYYRWCATGAGSNPANNRVWRMERARLSAEYYRLCPPSPRAPKTPSLAQRCARNIIGALSFKRKVAQ